VLIILVLVLIHVLPLALSRFQRVRSEGRKRRFWGIFKLTLTRTTPATAPNSNPTRLVPFIAGIVTRPARYRLPR
jgi:hypothetical protein